MALQLCTGSFAAPVGDKTYRFLAPQGWYVAFANFSVLTEGAVPDITIGAPDLTNDGWTGNSACKVGIANSGSGTVSMVASLLVSDEPVGQATVTSSQLVWGTGWGQVNDV